MYTKYDAKREYAANKNAKNAEIAQENGLTEDQTEALSWLCRIRHDMHCNQEAVFYSEHSKNSEYHKYLNGDIYDRLNEVGIENNLIWDTSENPLDIFCHSDECDDDDDEDSMTYDEGLDKTYEFMNKVNNEIESFLLTIDKKYGTEYCPTGYTRL